MRSQTAKISLGPLWSDYERYRTGMLSPVVDLCSDKHGLQTTNCIMEKVATQLSEYTGKEVRWFNNKDCSSWDVSEHGYSFFIVTVKKPWWKRLQLRLKNLLGRGQ